MTSQEQSQTFYLAETVTLMEKISYLMKKLLEI